MKNMMMNAEAAKAIIDDRKIQTRRAVKASDAGTIKDVKNGYVYVDVNYKVFVDNYKIPINSFVEKISKYQVGDIVWVREPVEIVEFIDTDAYLELSFKYIADSTIDSINSDTTEERNLIDFYEEKLHGKNWVKVGNRVTSGCLKEMARIFLKITDVRVERLQDISTSEIEKDAGVVKDKYKVCPSWADSMVIDFSILWDKTSPKGYKWEDNPYVFVYEFERTENG